MNVYKSHAYTTLRKSIKRKFPLLPLFRKYCLSTPLPFSVQTSVRESAPGREDASEPHFSRLSQSLLKQRKKVQLAIGQKEKGDWRADMKSYDRKIQSLKIKFLITEKRKEVIFC